MKQLFLIALRNLAQNTRRTLLLGGATAGVTALLVFLLCLSSGVHHTMLESATTVMTGHINVAGFYKVTSGQSAPLVTQYRRVEQVIRRVLPEAEYVSPRGRGWARLISDTATLQAAIGGIELAREPRFKKVIKITSGRMDDLAQPGTVLLFETQAKKLGVGAGDSLVISVLTPRGANNTVDVRVAAIAADIGILSSFNVFVPDTTLRQLYQINPDSVGALHIYLSDLKHIPLQIERLTAALKKEGYAVMEREATPYWQKFDAVNREDWTGQKLDLTSWDDEIAFIKWMAKAVDGLTFALTTVLLIIISIGIMNSMWISIRERTREIGTLRAIGMQRGRVLAMFVIEAFSLGALGTAAGTAIGLGLAALVHALHIPVPQMAQYFLMSSTMKLAFEGTRIVFAGAVITGSTTLIAVFPAIHAARMKPITAIQHIG